ncbi:hypothetical protein SAY86_019115 [Trapa natans]|uniref:K-box domain-containing protein n=1 Tax=Trapa natans TaxID=22666 RepID=A0AAN7LS87_TRANT|nr:hypothetical protein SAY86_019115 [Trapa natans]
MSEKTLDLSLIDISPDIINSVEKLQKLEQKLERDLEKVRSLKYQLLESEIDNTRKKVKMLEVNNVQMSNTVSNLKLMRKICIINLVEHVLLLHAGTTAPI